MCDKKDSKKAFENSTDLKAWLDHLGSDCYKNFLKTKNEIEKEYENTLKLREFDKALTSVYNRFLDMVFGSFSNRENREKFKDKLNKYAWCWFSIPDLNIIFIEDLEK